jgi:sugar phosphate isomerase/epimerase
MTGKVRALNLGCSLPLDYLAGDGQLGAGGSSWRDAFGPAGVCLDELRCAGVRSIEIRSVGPDADPARVLRAARRVWDAGMEVTVHGRLPTPGTGSTCAEVYPSLLPLVDALSGRGCDSVITLHCYSSQEGSVQDLASRTVRTLRELVEVLTREAIPLRFALENNHVSTRVVDPGLTYDGVADMVARVGSSRIGACWDFGHGYMNVQHGVDTSGPGAAFLERVIHTHVHDLGPRTHCPLTHGVVPLELYLDALIDLRYLGVFNLELSPERFAGPVRELVRASIDRLVGYGRRLDQGKNAGAQRRQVAGGQSAARETGQSSQVAKGDDGG